MSQQMKDTVREIVAQILSEYNQAAFGAQEQKAAGNLGNGVFPDIESAVEAAKKAQKELQELGLEKRELIIKEMRKAALEHTDEFSIAAVNETGIGNAADKKQKNMLAAKATPGSDDVQPQVFTDDHGMSLIERAPYGVIGAIIPVTNPTATVINNGISMVAGGNTVVFNPHPSAKSCSSTAVTALQNAVERAGGPKNVLTTAAEPTIETANTLMKHPDIALLVVTGGPGVVKAAMGSGKKVIAAGPGNPPCVVDETADIPKAARDIISGAGFDNNLVCICEKEVLVVDSVADELIRHMVHSGAFLLNSEQEKKITELVIKEPGGSGKEGIIQKEYVGKDAAFIASQINLNIPDSVKVLICDVEASHPLVWTEQLMPVLPIVRMPDVDSCIELARTCEHGFKHTAMMHSLNVEKLSKMAKVMDCSLFVKNGPCFAGLGFGGAGFTSFTIASPTGEGLTRARTFTRERRCTLVDYFRII